MNAWPRRQRGIALLVALLTVALATILIAGLLDRGELAFARTRNALRGEQADAYAQGLESYAAQVLLKDLGDDPGTDTNSDIWASPLPPQEIPGGVISASARDLNGCFNLNNLASARNASTWLAIFRRLLNVRGVDPAVADAVIGWLGSEADSSADAIDSYYLSLPVPYRSARRSFAHVSELRLVRGVGSDAYARLAPYLCALPPDTRLNVNTASVPVLQALADNLSQAQAENLWQNGTAHWDIGAFKTQLRQLLSTPTLDPALDSVIGTVSTYFLARGDINLDGVPFTFYSLIERRGGADGGIRVIERSRGSDDALVAPVLPQQAAGAMR
jgi:general secretion pathway protein K